MNMNTYLVPLCMNFYKETLYKHDNIDMHMRHHADFMIFYENVRICADFSKFDVRICTDFLKNYVRT